MNNIKKNNPSGFFEDADGNKSSTRLKTFISAIIAILIAVVDLFIVQTSVSDSLPIIITLLSFSAGEKSFQYFFESKLNSHE